MNCFAGHGFSFPLGSRSYVMGILNITPDSFSDGGLYSDTNSAVSRAIQIKADGADILDIGAVSTRPGHALVSPAQEQSRLAPVLEAVSERVSIPISVDTTDAAVAEFALSHGACIVNDVSGILSKRMAEVVLKNDAGWIVTHTGAAQARSQSCSDTASTEFEYEDVIKSVGEFFEEAFSFCADLGIPQSRLCLDVGFGFGKSYSDNIKLLSQLESLPHNAAIMAALSRKRMIGEATGRDVSERLAGTISANALALFSGADFIRVHDIRQGVDTAKLVDAVKSA